MPKKIKFIIYITIFCLTYFIFAYPPKIFAGSQTWTSGGPTGGNEMDLAVNKNNIYASGYNGIWKSIDKGLSWTEKDNGIPIPYDVNNVEVNSNNDNLVFASTWNQGLYKSVDGGNNWAKIDSFPGNYIRKIKINPYDGNILYVGTGSENQPGTIYKTIDGGNSWQELNLGTKGIIAYIVIEPINSQIITTGIINTSNPGRFKSEDGGISWVKFSNESNIDFPDFPTINPQLYYKIINNKLYISFDKGNSWSLTNNNGLPSNFQIRYLTIDHNNANIIFLFSIQYGVYKSKDAGNSWESINNGLLDSFDLSLFQDLYTDKNNPATLYITTRGYGVWQYSLLEEIPTPTQIPSPTPIPDSTPLQPVILLPGLGGSWNHENMILGIEKPQSEWYMTPGIKIYDGLIETFKNSGYKTNGKDQNLFVFNYNWTKPVILIAEDLKNYIQNVVAPSEGVKVDLVGHSLGGLIAKTYVQNNQNNHVDQLLTLGSPFGGIPSIYYLWEGGDLDKSFTPWQRIGIGLLLHLRKSGFSTTMEAIRSVTPILKDLLPTFNYLKDSSQEKPLNQMLQKNDWLIALNNSSSNYHFPLSNNFAGLISNSTIRWINVSRPSWLDRFLGLWVDGKPQNDEYDSGDKTVLAESAILNEANIVNLENIDHQELVTSNESQQKIMEILNLNPSSISNISSSLDYRSTLIFQIASPVAMEIFDEDSNPVGQGNGKLIIIPNAQDGKYQIKLTGMTEGQYTLYVGQITESHDFWTTVSGLINESEDITYFIQFNRLSPLKNPIIDESGENYLKTVQNQLFNLKEEIKQENLHQIVKKMILLNICRAKLSFDQYRLEKTIISLYELRMQISLWQKINKLDKKTAIYLKNKVQEIVNNLEEIYVIFKSKDDNQYHLKIEVFLANKDFIKMESKIKKISQNGITQPEIGVLYLLAQEKLNKAKKSTSSQVHINALGSRFLSNEGLFLISGR